MQHTHAEVIRAYADGKQIQFKDEAGDWENIDFPSFYPEHEYRVAPPLVKKYFTAINASGYDEPYEGANLCLTYETKTNELIAAEVLK